MSAPTASGLFHVSSSSLPLSSSSLLAAADDKHESRTSRDPLFLSKATRSKSFIQKPVVLFPTALDKKADDRGSSGSDSSSTSTASTGSQNGADDRRSSLNVPSSSSAPTVMAPIHPPPSYPKEPIQPLHLVDKPPTSASAGGGGNSSSNALPRKSMRKSASSIIASSLGIVGASNGATPRGSLSKSHSTTSPRVLSMASPSGSLGKSASGSVRSSSAASLDERSSSATAAAAALLELSDERRAALTEFIDKSVDDAYNLCHGFGRIRWHPFKTREGVSICRAHGEDDQRLDAAVRGKCNITASFHEMLDVLTTETTDDFAALESAMNPSEFLDGQVLATLVPRTPDDRFVCVKWHCIKSLAPSVAKHRDYVYVEVVDQFVAHDGKRVGYRLAKSVELDELVAPVLEATAAAHLFVRGKTLTVQTFSEVSPNNLELHTMMINDLGERLPTWLVHKIVDTAAMRVACIRDHLNQRRIDLLVFTAHARDVVPLSKRVCCIVCTKSFSLVRKKYNCVACGDVMCNQCSVHQLVSAQGLSEFVGKRKARICVKCSSGLTARELPRRSNLRQSDLSSDRSTASSTSTTRHSSERTRPGSMLESRSLRSMSSLEGSSSSDDGSRVHPTAAAGTRPSTIPHMFQFRPATAKPEPNAAPTPAAAELTPPPMADVESEEDDDMEHELFDATVDISTIAPQEIDLGVGRYKEVYVQQSQSERAVDSFLLEEDHHEQGESAAVASFLTQDCVVEHLASLASSAPVLTTMEELIVEEMVPGNRASSFSQPRRSTSVADASDVDDDAPVIVRKVEKLSIGAGGRKSRESRRPRAPPPPQPPVQVEVEPETADFTADFTVPVESVEITPSSTAAAPITIAEEESTLQLSDLQVHLDRMAQISASLRTLNVEKIESSTEATVAMRRLESFEKRANAEVAAVIAANFVSALEKSGSAGPLERPTYVPATVQPTGPPRFILTLAMGDGSIADFLLDSVFAEFTEPVEGILAGWQTVQSRTTGKVYYYNESCGATSWTIPAPEMHRGAVYMVL